MIIDLTPRLRLAADYLEQHGWTQGQERDSEGRVCLSGAIRFCAPQTGDEYLIGGVLQRWDCAQEWNDNGDRTYGQVVYLLRHAEITDADLEVTFGPQWREIVTLVRQAANLTAKQAKALMAARGTAWSGAWESSLNAARDASRKAWESAWRAAQYAAWDATPRTRPHTAAWDAARAAAAISTRDLIGTAGYTQEHFNILINPWVSVMGMPEAATS